MKSVPIGFLCAMPLPKVRSRNIRPGGVDEEQDALQLRHAASPITVGNH